MAFMIIKEAMVRIPAHEPLLKKPAENDERGVNYKEMTLQKGIALLKEAGVPGMLNELLGEIKPTFPDAEITDWRALTSREQPDENAVFVMSWDGSALMRIKWNNRRPETETEDQRKMFGLLYDTVTVYAEPVTGDVVVEGKEQTRIPKSSWSTAEGKIVLEDALVKAYRNPGTKGVGVFATPSRL